MSGLHKTVFRYSFNAAALKSTWKTNSWKTPLEARQVAWNLLAHIITHSCIKSECAAFFRARLFTNFHKDRSVLKNESWRSKVKKIYRTLNAFFRLYSFYYSNNRSATNIGQYNHPISLNPISNIMIYSNFSKTQFCPIGHSLMCAELSLVKVI